VSLHELAELFARTAGRRVAYVEETTAEAYASRAGFGAPSWQLEGWVSTYRAIASGELDVVTGDVARLLGRPAESLEDYLRGHPEVLDLETPR
jgi:uncharacterized protein YbjT (DUF2867 family)